MYVHNLVLVSVTLLLDQHPRKEENPVTTVMFVNQELQLKKKAEDLYKKWIHMRFSGYISNAKYENLKKEIKQTISFYMHQAYSKWVTF